MSAIYILLQHHPPAAQPPAAGVRALVVRGTKHDVGEPLEILELRSAVAGAPPCVVRDVLENHLPRVAPPATILEFDAWTWALFDLGLAAETIPESTLALDLYSRSIACNRTSELLRSAALVRMGLCLEQLGRWMEAVQAYRQAEPGSKEWPESRALLLWRLGRLLRASEEFEDASGVLSQLFDLLPQPGIPWPEASLELASCLENSGQCEKAISRLTELASGNHPVAVDALARLASLYLRFGRTNDAAHALCRITSHPSAEARARTAAAIRLDQLDSL